MASIAPVQRSYNEMPGLDEYRTWGAGEKMGAQLAFRLGRMASTSYLAGMNSGRILRFSQAGSGEGQRSSNCNGIPPFGCSVICGSNCAT